MITSSILNLLFGSNFKVFSKNSEKQGLQKAFISFKTSFFIFFEVKKKKYGFLSFNEGKKDNNIINKIDPKACISTFSLKG